MTTDLIAYSVHEGYAAPTAVSALSVLANTSGPVEFLILDVGMSKETRNELATCLGRDRVHLVDLPEDAGLGNLALSNLVHAKRLGVEMYGKLLLPELAASAIENSERLLYLDCDTLVTGDIKPVFRVDLEERAVAGTLCFTQPTFDAPEGVPDYMALGWDASTPALDSGVMLIDIDKWCDENIGRRAINYARTHENLPLGDLTATDAIVGPNWTRIGYQWNFQVFEPLRESYRGPIPIIYHFSGRHKPFLLGSKFPDAQILYEAYSRLALAAGAPRFGDSTRVSKG